MLAIAATLFTVLFGFLMAAACGYLAGLLGSSSSPISGIGILTTMATALLLPFILGHSAGPEGDRFVTGMALLLTAVVITTSSIANDNLQDLKTGQVLGATPWHQQVALIIGVGVGAVVIAPLLSLLYEAYGFVGAPARDGHGCGKRHGGAAGGPDDPDRQRHHARRTAVDHGADRRRDSASILVAAEAWLKRRDLTFPALTVGIGMYLPLSVEVTIAIGGILGWLAERRLRARVGGKGDARAADKALGAARRRGVLLASGFLVGESLRRRVARRDRSPGRPQRGAGHRGQGFRPLRRRGSASRSSWRASRSITGWSLSRARHREGVRDPSGSRAGFRLGGPGQSEGQSEGRSERGGVIPPRPADRSRAALDRRAIPGMKPSTSVILIVRSRICAWKRPKPESASFP